MSAPPKPEYLLETLIYLRDHPGVRGPADVSSGMGLSVQEAKARIRELLDRGLIVRNP